MDLVCSAPPPLCLQNEPTVFFSEESLDIHHQQGKLTTISMIKIEENNGRRFSSQKNDLI